MFAKRFSAWFAAVASLMLIASGSLAHAQTLSPTENGDSEMPFWDFTSLTVLAEEGVSVAITEELFESRVDIRPIAEFPDFGYFAYSVPSLDGQYLRLVEGEVVSWSDQISFSSTTLMRAPEEISGVGSETFTDGNRTFNVVASASGTTDEWVWWECTKAGLCGLGQGAVNIANGVQDTVIGVANIPAAAVNGIAWTEEQLGILDGDDPIRVPYIPSPDWSKDLIVEEDDFSHGVSKFSGAAGVEILTSVWIAKIAKAHRVTGLIDDAPISGAGRKLFSSLDDFKARSGFVFRSDTEAAKAFEVYQNAGKAQKGIVIGHDLDPINQGYNGWQAFRMKADDWTYEINMSWIDGAVDAGKPVLIATPYDKIKVGSITWQEMMRVINRGGKVVFER